MAAELLKLFARRIHDGALREEEDWPFKRNYLNLQRGGDAMSVEDWHYLKSRLKEYVREGLSNSNSLRLQVKQWMSLRRRRIEDMKL